MVTTAACLTSAKTIGCRVTFKDPPPNLEDPKDANQDNKYVVDVIATDDQKLTGKTTLTITVTQVDEDGEVSFSSIQPAIGVAITASVKRPRRQHHRRELAVGQSPEPGRHLLGHRRRND